MKESVLKSCLESLEICKGKPLTNSREKCLKETMKESLKESLGESRKIYPKKEILEGLNQGFSERILQRNRKQNPGIIKERDSGSNA